MLKHTPFHPRLVELSQTQSWGNWAGYLSATRYDLSTKHEYFAVRNAAGFFDTSPLHKYWIRGRDAEKFLSYVFARDIRTLKAGRAQREHDAAPDRGPVERVGEDVGEVVEADELAAAAPGLFQREGPIQRLRRRPVEEHENDQKLRRQQGGSNPAELEIGAAHGHPPDRKTGRDRLAAPQ